MSTIYTSMLPYPTSFSVTLPSMVNVQPNPNTATQSLFVYSGVVYLLSFVTQNDILVGVFANGCDISSEQQVLIFYGPDPTQLYNPLSVFSPIEDRCLDGGGVLRLISPGVTAGLNSIISISLFDNPNFNSMNYGKVYHVDTPIYNISGLCPNDGPYVDIVRTSKTCILGETYNRSLFFNWKGEVISEQLLMYSMPNGPSAPHGALQQFVGDYLFTTDINPSLKTRLYLSNDYSLQFPNLIDCSGLLPQFPSQVVINPSYAVDIGWPYTIGQSANSDFLLLSQNPEGVRLISQYNGIDNNYIFDGSIPAFAALPGGVGNIAYIDSFFYSAPWGSFIYLVFQQQTIDNTITVYFACLGNPNSTITPLNYNFPIVKTPVPPLIPLSDGGGPISPLSKLSNSKTYLINNSRPVSPLGKYKS